MKLVQACLNAGEMKKAYFLFRGGPVKLVQACLSARKDGESSFHHCVGLVKLVQAVFFCPGKIEKEIFITVEML